MAYQSGLTNYRAVLDAQQKLLLTDNALAQSDQFVDINLVVFYKVPGGGWNIQQPKEAQAK